ncbi:polysaccharide biosynthesis tyrosine autokinase [Streptosporangium lutulentum]|nr:polysaccharide biosynthesis tyrosine autokinase [Streptosporangium lutulentum]
MVTDPMSSRESLEVADYAGILRRRWWIVVAAAAAGLAAAAMAVVVLPQSYVSQAVVLVTNSADLDRTAMRVSIDTEAQRVRSVEVARRAGQLLKSSESPVDLTENVTVTTSGESAILQIDFEGSSALQAQQGAHAFAVAYLDSRREKGLQRSNGQVSNLQSQLEELEQQLKKVPASSLAEREIIMGQFEVLGRSLADAKIEALNVASGEIIMEASLPEGPASPSPVTFLPGGLIVGLMLGVMTALLIDRSDKRVRSGHDVARVLKMRILLDVPPGRRHNALGLLAARSRVGQRFHELCHSLTAILGSGPSSHVIVVSSASPGKGGNIVAANIAATLTRIESNVLLVSADLESRVSTGLLGVQGSGLAELLLQDSTLDEVEVSSPVIPRLRVIPAGQRTELVSEMLQGARMSRLVNSLRNRARFIVIDAPSTAFGADTQALAEIADIVVLTAEAHDTRYDQIRDGAQQMERVGAPLVGVVVIPQQTEVPFPPPRGAVITSQPVGKPELVRGDEELPVVESGPSTEVFSIVKDMNGSGKPAVKG